MTNHCLSIGPTTRELAENCASRLEALARPRTQALSISECDPTGMFWQVDAYYPNADEASRAATLAVALGFETDALTITRLEQTDWVARSLRILSPVRAGRFFVHGSHDRSLIPSNAIAIEIDAGTAFGTGHHGTTRGCLLALDHLLRRESPRRVIDIGCGSGILAIAASKATHRPVTACDIDPEAVRLTALNARLNGAKVTAMRADGGNHRSIIEGQPYDLIMSNILARPLAALAPAFARLAGKNRHLILSGLLTEQQQWIEQVYRHLGFLPHRIWRLDGWSTLLLRRLNLRHPGEGRGPA
jgi:ribosomal protein L11 methyltransferase